MNSINITLSKTTTKLSELIVTNEAIQNKFDFTLTIQDNQTAIIIDDLFLYSKNQLDAQHNLTFIVKENAHLIYSLKMNSNKENEISSELSNYKNYEQSYSLEKKINVKLSGPYAKATIKCAILRANKESLKMTTLQLHEAPHTSSTLEVKTVLDDHSKFLCNSLIKIEKQAQQTIAHLENKNILLSNKSRAISIPQLEIEANEVKCGHGATVSKLNANDLFYLQSRGINLSSARQLLINSFLNFE